MRTVSTEFRTSGVQLSGSGKSVDNYDIDRKLLETMKDIELFCFYESSAVTEYSRYWKISLTWVWHSSPGWWHQDCHLLQNQKLRSLTRWTIITASSSTRSSTTSSHPKKGSPGLTSLQIFWLTFRVSPASSLHNFQASLSKWRIVLTDHLI